MYSQTQSLLVIDLFNHFAHNLINILAKTYEDLNFVQAAYVCKYFLSK